MVGATGTFNDFCLYFQNLLPKWVWKNVELSKSKGGQISNHQGWVSILCFPAQLGKVSSWGHQIWNPLEMVHLMMPEWSFLMYISNA
jgi:hypothetical protein